jgi:hypothetical protein
LHKTLSSYLEGEKTKLLILAFRWGKDIYDLEQQLSIGNLNESSVQEVVLSRLESFLSTLPKELKVILIGSIPSAEAASKTMREGYVRCHYYADSHCPTHYPISRRDDAEINAALSAFSQSHDGVYFLDPMTSLCDANVCFIVRNGPLIYSDQAHLTNYGASLVVQDLVTKAWFQQAVATSGSVGPAGERL